MKNLIFLSLTIFTVLLFSLQSCEKGENPLKPYQETDHPFVWQQNLKIHFTGSKIIPAMDEQDNIYFAVQKSGPEPIAIYSLDKAGNEVWVKKFSGTLASQIIYHNNNIYFSVAGESPNNTIYCLEANTGNLNWQQQSIQNTGCVMAVSDNYILTGAKTGGYKEDDEKTWEVQVLDKAGNEVIAWHTGYGIAAVSIVNNKFYVIGHHVSGVGYHKIKLTKYDITSGSVEWTYQTGKDEQNWRVASPDLVVDKDDKIYFVSQYGLEIALHIIDSDGSLFKEIKLNQANDITLTPSLDMEGNIYIGAPGHLQKYSPSGDFLWTFDDYNYTSVTLNISYAVPLATGNMFYYGGEGLVAAKTTPEMSWIKYPENTFTASSYPLLNSNGDIVVVGDGYVFCIKGDGQHLLNSAWPKVYQNNGNTASR